jgi:hypothetical protein
LRFPSALGEPSRASSYWLVVDLVKLVVGISGLIQKEVEGKKSCTVYLVLARSVFFLFVRWGGLRGQLVAQLWSRAVAVMVSCYDCLGAGFRQVRIGRRLVVLVLTTVARSCGFLLDCRGLPPVGCWF